MRAIVFFFIELALLRRAPQDLPASPVLLGLLLIVGLAASLLLSASAGVGLGLGLVQALLDLALMLAVLYAALNWRGRAARFVQTATALVGADTLVGLIALLPFSLVAGSSAGSDLYALAGLLFLALVVWSVVVAGHILRHAFTLTLTQGAAFAFFYKLLALMLIGVITGQ